MNIVSWLYRLPRHNFNLAETENLSQVRKTKRIFFFSFLDCLKINGYKGEKTFKNKVRQSTQSDLLLDSDVP